MKTEPISSDEFSGENSNGSVETNEPENAYLCPRCYAFFVTHMEMLQHFHQQVMNHLLTLEHTAPPFPIFFNQSPENLHGHFHAHEMTAIFPTPPPPPPPPFPERVTNMTLDLLSFMDQPAAVTVDEHSADTTAENHAEHMGTVPFSGAVPPAFAPVFAPPPAAAAAPEPATAEIAPAPPVVAPAAVSVKREDADEPEQFLKP